MISREALENNVVQFEKDHGSVAFLQLALSSLNKLLVSKGVVTQEELREFLNNDLMQVKDELPEEDDFGQVVVEEDSVAICEHRTKHCVIHGDAVANEVKNNDQINSLVNATFLHPEMGVSFYVESVHNGIALMKRNEIVLVNDLLGRWAPYDYDEKKGLLKSKFVHPFLNVLFYVESVSNGKDSVAIMRWDENVPVNELLEKWKRYTEFDGVIENHV